MNILERLKSDFVYIRGLSNIQKATSEFGPESSVLVPDIIERTVDRHPDNDAFWFEGKKISYEAFDRRANKFANWALSQGYRAGDCIALFLENCPDYVAIWYGLSKIGVTTALINSNLTGAGLGHCISIVSAREIITSMALLDIVEASREWLSSGLKVRELGQSCGELSLFEDELLQASDLRPLRDHRNAMRGKDVALYVYTSGTTGLPKAARMTHARCLDMMVSFATPCKITPQDRIYEALPLYHGTCGVCGVGSALTAGAAIVLRRKFSSKAFWQEAADTGATVFVYVGELGRYLMNNPPNASERSHKISRGFGNGMRRDVWRAFVERTGIDQLVEFYGSTEGNVSLINLDGKIGSIGRIPPMLKNRMRTRILKIDLETMTVMRDARGFCIEAQPGEAGEAVGEIISEKSRSRFEGYEDQEATEKKILKDVFKVGDAFFRTGDLLVRDAAGYFEFVDRLGDTFRWKSENVSTGEVAQVLERHPSVLTANVYGVEVPGYDGRAGMAAITVENTFDPVDIYATLQRDLPSYAQPVFLRLVEKDTMTGTLKLQKTALSKLGYDPTAAQGKVYIKDPAVGAYRLLSQTDVVHLAEGSFRL